MFITDPDNPQEPTNATPDGADAAAAAQDPEQTVDEAMTEALDAGLEKVAPAEPEPAPEPEAPEPPVPGTDAAKDADGQAAAPGEPAEPAKDEATEKEIGDLKLGEKAATRFRDMAKQVKELAPIREQMEKAGIKDLADLPKVFEKAKAADEIIGMVMETGASSDQYGKTLDYLKLVNSRDPGDLHKAFDTLQQELVDLGRIIGREVQGAYDPLADHEDLRGEVEAGDLSRARALEIAKQRTSDKVAGTRQAEATDASAQQAAVQEGRVGLNALGAELAKADPDFAGKQPTLVAILQAITASTPPAQWVEAARRAYATIPAPPKQPAAKPAPGPMRGAQVAAPLEPTTDDPMAALELGLARVNAEAA